MSFEDDVRSVRGRGVSIKLWKLIVLILVLVGLTAVFNGGACNCVNSTISRYTIVGTVEGAEGRLSTLSSKHAEQKFSVTLTNVTGNIPSEFQSGSDEEIVNCNSTQCASLREGQRVELSCYKEFHWFQPNEQECRFVRLLKSSGG